MTQPTVDQVEAQADESLAYEQAAEGTVVAALAVEVSVAVAIILTAYATLAGAMAAGTLTAVRLNAALTTLAEQVLAGIDPDMRAELDDQINDGLAMGARHAREVIGAAPVRAGIQDQALRVVSEHLDDNARRRLDEAVQLAQVLDLSERRNVDSVVARAHTSVTASEAATRWAANRAVNAGVAAVARRHDLNLLWIAERDACLHCLAYSGLVTEPGRPFPSGLTFAARPLHNPHPIPYPPLHPNCRCRISPWEGGPGSVDIGDPRAPSALKREARRSVVRGDSAYASEPARLRAADQLLAAGANLPKSVIERGQRAVARGAFETPTERRRRSGR